jgi:hypothetical protein
MERLCNERQLYCCCYFTKAQKKLQVALGMCPSYTAEMGENRNVKVERLLTEVKLVSPTITKYL